jgi:hypothetical protein
MLFIMVGNTKKHNKGFSALEALIILVILGLVGFAGYHVAHKAPPKTNNSALAVDKPAKPGAVTWLQTYDGYKPDGTTPACPTPMIKQFPADINKVTSVLYPGQYRGGNYKPHGGLRFDKSANDEVTVRAPFDGTVIDGGAYIAEGSDNDVQYTFDVMHDCGMMYRVGHLLTLSKSMADIARHFPAAVKGDSRTTVVDPGVKVKAGTVLATAVGTASGKNTFFDLGVYDWRQANNISTFPAWLEVPQHNNPLAKHAVCWFELLPKDVSVKIKSLPASDPASGKASDYCR